MNWLKSKAEIINETIGEPTIINGSKIRKSKNDEIFKTYKLKVMVYAIRLPLRVSKITNYRIKCKKINFHFSFHKSISKLYSIKSIICSQFSFTKIIL